MRSARTERQKTIERLVRGRQLRTQAELVDALRGEGFEVAQATVSRDIADIDLRKDKDGIYVLAVDERLRTMVAAAVVETRRAGNQLIVITDPGSAPSVAAAIDAARPDGVLGSIAGDDTVLVIGSDDEATRAFQENVDRVLANG